MLLNYTSLFKKKRLILAELWVANRFNTMHNLPTKFPKQIIKKGIFFSISLYIFVV